MRYILIIIASIQLTPSWSQLYFNNVYDRPDFLAEWCGQVEIRGINYVTPIWFWRLDQSAHYGIRQIDQEGNESEISQIDSSFSSFSGGYAWNFQSTSDGGYVYGGMLDTACIIKISPDYQMQWRTNVGVFGGSMRSVNELANGQFFCTWVDLTQASDGVDLYWFSPDGSLTTSIHYSIDGTGMYDITDIQQLPTGDLLLSLNLQQGLLFDNIISRLDGTTGDVIWQRRLSIGSFTHQLGETKTILESADQATVTLATKDSFPDQFDPTGDYFGRLGTYKLDLSNGDTSFVHYLQGPFHGHSIADFEKTPDNGYILLIFETNPLYSWKKQLIKLDSNRNEEWRKEYNPLPIDQMDSQYAEILDVDVCPDSGYVVSGWTQDTKTVPTFHNGKQVPWVFKTDACGDLVWNNCGITSMPKPNDQSANNKSISIYPNPSNGIVNVSCNSTFNAINIKDLTGRTIHSTTNKNHLLQTTLDVSNLSDGVYLILVDFENGTQGSTKLVVE